MNCNLCLSENSKILIDFGRFPIAHQYMKTKLEHRESYPFELVHCEDCHHVFIAQPISPNILYKNYVTVSSWKFHPHVPRLIELIQSCHVNKNAKILEIGCNDGVFLKVLKDLGYSNLTGIEPTEDACLLAKQKGINIIQDFFNEQSAGEYVNQYGKCDLIILRQVLEHIPNLTGFRNALRKVISPGSIIIIEVPDFQSNLNTYDYSLWEEHVNYFSKETLNYFLHSIGVEEIHFERFLFSGVGQIVIGQCVNNNNASLKNVARYKNDILKQKILNYANFLSEFKANINDFLAKLVAQGKKISLYGAGNRTATLVNFTGIEKYIEFVVDDQVEKQHLFMPGSCLEVFSSDFLQKHNIDVCLMGVNTENEQTVINKHISWSEGKLTFYSILPPSNRLIPFWRNLIANTKQDEYFSYS
ncbi:MAG: hypothetical protein A3F11_03280 [Gammaproteobacteria bacterium RIFCSPHIGHO2_12_FULL_37_14]|nr:MAG: hypothetical protein A3F11_03280 [Gammaproteobacteria bacterium RIFCSPHIGHO2_12_FULL_37_14]